MALVRILVDGYSLLHNWPQLAPGKARHSARARDELIRKMTLYQDAIHTPITIVFDGASGPNGAKSVNKTEGEVIYSRSGQTADQLIERAVHRFADYGEVLAVTDDLAERQTVHSLGGLFSSCASFVQSVEDALSGMKEDIGHHNRREKLRFQSKH